MSWHRCFVLVALVACTLNALSGAESTSPVTAAATARLEAEAQLSAARSRILDERAAVAKQLAEAQRGLGDARQAAAAAAAECVRREDELRQRRRDAERDQQLTRQAGERLMSAARLDGDQLAKLANADVPTRNAAAVAGLSARLVRLRADLAVTRSDEEVLSRRGEPAKALVLRMGAARAVALGNDPALRGFLSRTDQGRWVVGGPALSSDPAVAKGRIPLDVDGGLARQLPGAATSLREWFRSGGVFMWAILAVGVVGISMLLERTWWLMRSACPPSLIGRVLGGLGQSDTDPALVPAHTPLQRVLVAAVAAHRKPRAAREAALEEALLAEEPALERGLSLLAVLAATAPLLGLLGTVSGMIGMFETIAGHGAGNLRLLSGSISEALVATQFGLIVAVPLLVGHACLARAVERRQGVLEEAASAFLGREPVEPAP